MHTNVKEEDVLGTDWGQCLEILKDRLYFTSSEDVLEGEAEGGDVFVHFRNLGKLDYTPFYRDFGPYSLGCVASFCNVLDLILGKNKANGKRVVLMSCQKRRTRLNNVTLVGCYLISSCRYSVDEVKNVFKDLSPPTIRGYRDASYGNSRFMLYFEDIIGGLRLGSVVNDWFNYKNFRLDEYFHYEQPRNGDLNWIIPHRLLAFGTPVDERKTTIESVSHSPKFYVELFKKWGVQAVFRFNRARYNPTPFHQAKIIFMDLYYEDGSVPSDLILSKAFEVFQNKAGVIAFHCKSGIGRTGTVIAAILIKYYSFTARQAIGWLRLCRPGSVLGEQQQFLVDFERKMREKGGYLYKE